MANEQVKALITLILLIPQFECLSYYSSFCSKLRILKFSFMKFKLFNAADHKLLQKTFQSLHNLEELTMNDCGFEGYTSALDSTLHAVNIESLKKITLISTHHSVSILI